MEESKVKKAKAIIYGLSVIIPVVVAFLFRIKIEGVDLGFLPPIYASINGLTAILLLLALAAIKKGNRSLHEGLIKFCLVLSLLFLGSYVAYHMTSDPTEYKGSVAPLYYFILISHIILSVMVIPIVLFSYLFAWQGNFERHRRWTKYAWPLWFYVAISGVVVYLMISPFYN